MKLFYYYLRNRDNWQPFGCVCFGAIVDEGHRFCRGISLCSYKDQFVKRTARNMARGRLLSAIKHKKSTEMINYNYENRVHDALAKLTSCNDLVPITGLLLYKSDYNVTLTPFESEIIKDENII
ncbi:hypothetical protein ACFLQL_03025 [Verrucomicrobiota bacterium]